MHTLLLKNEEINWKWKNENYRKDFDYTMSGALGQDQLQKKLAKQPKCSFLRLQWITKVT